tara:strand:+ start:4780 stop:5760 length:981 start_codon:yes stop_codon:yes gene_type:complete
MPNLEEFFLDDPWESVNDSNYPESAVAFYAKDERFWAAKKDQNQLVFFIQIPIKVSTEIIESLSGTLVEIVNYDTYNSNTSRLVITLEEIELKDKFIIMTKALAFNLSSQSDDSIFQSAKKELGEWSNFLKPNRKGLTREEQIGLWGELYVFTEFMIALHPLTDAIKYWIGPDQKKQDFTLNDLAIETKTTMSGDSARIQISSLEQLDKITSRLFLSHIFINSSDDGKSIQDYFDELDNLMSGDLESQIKFTKKISRFRNRATEKQLNEKFYFLELRIYEVTENFPKITRLEVDSNAILNVKYSLDAQQLRNFYVGDNIQELLRNG